MDAKWWIRTLGLEEHPEGGYFKETYRAEMEIDATGFEGRRAAGTAIYYLLKGCQFSAFHRMKSDEIWHYYAGSPLAVHIIDGSRHYQKITLGKRKGQSPQAVVKAGCWFAAALDKPSSYSLVGCTVAPGFDFRDWEVGRREELLKLHSKHRQIIEKFTRQ
jgi:predicted cupin superfamily sugar epimerase